MNIEKRNHLTSIIGQLKTVKCYYQCDEKFIGNAVAYLTDYLDRLKSDDNQTIRP